jgi:DNA repair protein RadC
MGLSQSDPARDRGLAPSPAQGSGALARLLTPFEGEICASGACLGDILRASPEDIGRRYSAGLVARITDLQAACVEMLREETVGRTISRPADVADYLQARMARLPREEVRVLFLDSANHLIGDELMGIGSLNEVSIYPREVLRRALQLGANAIIVAHNHPSGPLTPSEKDVTTTRALVSAAAAVEVAVHDHILVSRRGWLSMRGEGLV